MFEGLRPHESRMFWPPSWVPFNKRRASSAQLLLQWMQRTFRTLFTASLLHWKYFKSFTYQRIEQNHISFLLVSSHEVTAHSSQKPASDVRLWRWSPSSQQTTAIIITQWWANTSQKSRYIISHNILTVVLDGSSSFGVPWVPWYEAAKLKANMRVTGKITNSLAAQNIHDDLFTTSN
mgnify:CR=1 FL=1